MVALFQRLVPLIFISSLMGNSTSAWAAEVVTQVQSNQVFMIISQAKPDQWRMDERVCFYRNEERVACGLIVQLKERTAVVKIVEQKKMVKLGDVVRPEEEIKKTENVSKKAEEARLAPPVGPTDRQPTSEPCRDVAFLPPPGKRHLLIGANTGLQTTQYFTHLQGFISDNVAIGLSPGLLKITYDSSGTTITTIGVVFTANYYRQGQFRGLWLQFGSGFYTFSANNGNLSETSLSPALISTIGWRANWALGLNIGLAIGARYVTLPQRANVTVPFSEIQPIANLDIGFDF